MLYFLDNCHGHLLTPVKGTEMTMLSRYYRLRGWDENDVPTPETLWRLELDEWTL